MPTLAPKISLATLALAAALAAVPGCRKDGANTCNGAKACTSPAQCGLGEDCLQGGCVRLDHFCATDRVAMNDRGESWDCGYYLCQFGACKHEAADSSECKGGTGWDDQTFQCVCPALPAPCGGWDNNAPPAYDRSCFAACAKDQDCGEGHMCFEGRCAAKTPFCKLVTTPNSREWFAIYPLSSISPATGNYAFEQQGCGNFACDLAAGSCLTTCQVTEECLAGASCLQGACVF